MVTVREPVERPAKPFVFLMETAASARFLRFAYNPDRLHLPAATCAVRLPKKDS
jgi:hypothetical protein